MATDAANQTDHADPTPDPPRVVTSRSGHLLDLVRDLVAYGQRLVIFLRSDPDPELAERLASRFGTLSIVLVIARITRGLMLARALEQRLMRSRAALDNPPTPPAPQPARPAGPTAAQSADDPPPTPRTRRRHAKRDPNDESLLAGLPSAEEIAARLRGRRIGDVLIDICHDFGIVADHPRWREIQEAVLLNGGGAQGLPRDIVRRVIDPALRRYPPVEQARNLPGGRLPQAQTTATGPP